jgi:predicted lipoprotein with Yx(FWY)xxD motif
MEEITMRRLAILLPIAAIALIGSGCGSEDSDRNDAATDGDATTKASDNSMSAERATSTDAAATAHRGTRIKVVSSDYGTVIADGKGEAFYLFDAEETERPECYAACAKAWPPVLTKGNPRAGTGAKASMLGTTTRRNGKLQVTYAGHPLYYYVADSPGTILCHDVPEFGGTWLVVQPNGQAAT